MGEMPEKPPEAELLQGLFGFMLTRGISVVAGLGVADELKRGPLTGAELAEGVGAQAKPLQRVMRMLAAAGVFEETQTGQYKLNPVSDLLRSEHPASMRALAVMITAESHWQPWGRLEDTVQSGNSGPQHVFGTDIFSWFQRPENRVQWDIFNRAMTSFSAGMAPLVVKSYSFARFQKIADIGGGNGLLLRTILEATPDAAGILFDLPGVWEAAANDDLGGRIEFVAGDFFEAVPADFDCYTLKHIIHDWGDEASRKILANIAEAMAPAGRVLLIETIMPEGPEPHPAKFMDVNMLAMTEGGCERTEREYAELFAAAGLELCAVHATPGPLSVIEAAKV